MLVAGDLALLHRLANLPVNDIAAVAVEHTAQVVKRPADIHVRDVHMRMFMWSRGLFEAPAFPGRRLRCPAQQAGLLERAIRRAGTDRDDVAVQHHER